MELRTAKTCLVDASAHDLQAADRQQNHGGRITDSTEQETVLPRNKTRKSSRDGYWCHDAESADEGNLCYPRTEGLSSAYDVVVYIQLSKSSHRSSREPYIVESYADCMRRWLSFEKKQNKLLLLITILPSLLYVLK